MAKRIWKEFKSELAEEMRLGFYLVRTPTVDPENREGWDELPVFGYIEETPMGRELVVWPSDHYSRISFAGEYVSHYCFVQMPDHPARRTATVSPHPDPGVKGWDY